MQRVQVLSEVLLELDQRLVDLLLFLGDDVGVGQVRGPHLADLSKQFHVLPQLKTHQERQGKQGFVVLLVGKGLSSVRVDVPFLLDCVLEHVVLVWGHDVVRPVDGLATVIILRRMIHRRRVCQVRVLSL